MKCKFCELFQFNKEQNRKFGIQMNYYAGFEERIVKKGQERGIIRHCTEMKLNFCPVCGKNLMR